MTPSPLQHALDCLIAARSDEQLAKERREEAERAVLSHVQPTEEGTVRADTDSLRVAIRFSVNRSVDTAALAALAPEIPEAIGKRLLRWKPELVMTELRYLESNEPEIFAKVARAITAKPAKPSISIEPTKEH